MSRTAFIAVDLGAQSGRVMLGVFADDGFSLEEVHRFTNTPVVVGADLCWDVEALFEQTLAGLALAVAAAKAAEAPIGGIGVDGWGVDYGLVDADLRLVAPVRHYRATTEETMREALSHVPDSRAYAITGIDPLPINTCFQLFRDARRGMLTGTRALLTPDLWTAWLCGAVGAERSIASTTGLIDRDTLHWSAELMAAWSIPADVLPDLVPSGTIAGWTTDRVTERIGATSPIPVVRCPAHDTACAFASIADPDDGQAVISCGTWALVGCSTKVPVRSAQAHALGFTNEEGADGAITLIRNLSGTWLLDECLRDWHDTTGESTSDLRASLIAKAAERPSSQHTIDVSAIELLEPGDMPARLNAIHRREHGDRDLEPHELVRLIIDSLAEAFAATVRDAGDLTGHRLERIHMLGGGANIPLLVERTAEASGLPVHVGSPEATSLGNVCVQAVASGMMPSIAAARRRTAAGGTGRAW